MITKMGVPFNGLAGAGFSISYVKGGHHMFTLEQAGAGFSGSYKGMRFFMKTYDKENISVFVYPEPYNFENTKDENKEKVEFPYTHEGVDQCIDWLNQKYIDDKDKWDEAFNSRMNAE